MKRSLTADRHDSPDQDLPDEFDGTTQDEIVVETAATIIETAAILWAFDFFDEDQDKLFMNYIITITVMITSIFAQTEIKYNYLEDYYDFAGTDDALRYNYIEDRYEFAGVDDKLRYNIFEDEYEYAESTDQLRFNFLDDKYEFAPKDAHLQYNYMEDKYGFDPVHEEPKDEFLDIFIDDFTEFEDPIPEYVDP